MIVHFSRTLAALLLAFVTIEVAACGPKLMRAEYRFELAGQPQRIAPGINVVLIRLVKVPENTPVSGAVLFELKADMSPEQMVGMTAPVRVLPEAQPGIYPLEISFGNVSNQSGKWALTFSAKLQGETQTVQGNVTAQLEP